MDPNPELKPSSVPNEEFILQGADPECRPSSKIWARDPKSGDKLRDSHFFVRCTRKDVNRGPIGSYLNPRLSLIKVACLGG